MIVIGAEERVLVLETPKPGTIFVVVAQGDLNLALENMYIDKVDGYGSIFPT